MSESVWACRWSFHCDTGTHTTHWVFQLKPTPARRATALQQYSAPPHAHVRVRHACADTRAADRPQTHSRADDDGWCA